MSLTETPPQLEPETERAVRPRRRSLSRFVGPILTLLLVIGLGGLGVWAAQSSSDNGPAVTLKATETASVPNSTVRAKNSETAKVYEVVADPAEYQIIFAATSAGLRRSSDGGQSWANIDAAELKNQAISALAVDGDDPERPIYVGTRGNGLFKSNDGGKTWADLGLKGRNVTALVAYKTAVYVGVGQPFAGVYHSSDAGKTFAPADSGNLPPEIDIHSLAIDYDNPSNVYIGTAYIAGKRSADYDRVKVSRDSGRTWRGLGDWSTSKSGGPDLRSPVSVLLYAPGDRVYAGDGARLFRLSPDRANWLLVSGLPETVYGLANDPQLPGIVYAATNDGFYRNNGGVEWQKLSEGKAGPIFGATSPAFVGLPGLIAANTHSTANSVNGLSTTYLYGLAADGRLVSYENREFGKSVVASVPGFKEPDFSAYNGVNPAAGIEPPASDVPPDPAKAYFPETKHYLYGGFKLYWEKNGGLSVFGYPITEEFPEFIPNLGLSRTVQYFERVRLEFDPTGKQGPEVTVGLLGREAVSLKYYVPGRYIPNTATQAFYSETKHTLRQNFFQFWNRNNGLARFGFPLSEEVEEKSPVDGKTTTVQYFERVKLELNKATNQVQVGLLGREILVRRGWLKPNN